MKVIWRGPQYHGTEALHHYIEKNTALGQIMHVGNPTPDQYVGWLSLKARFFDAVDEHIPPACRRADRYRADIAAMGRTPVVLDAAERHVAWVNQSDLSAPEKERRKTGTAYVCVGSCFGSMEIKSRIKKNNLNVPTDALDFADQATELSYLKQLRYRGDCTFEARMTFAAMVECCEEITGGADAV